MVTLLAGLQIVPQGAEPLLERTCFQTGQGYSDTANLRSDVAIVYGIDPGLPQRVNSWRERGYRIHVMTGVSWGNYQDYLYGRFDGVNHEDEAQTDRRGNKVSHGGDIYYMCPGENFGKFLCRGVQRALDAGAEAIHLEEPEFWVRSGYSEGFKREWQRYYGEAWIAPHSSPDAQWRASKLKSFLYRRALQQVFDYVQADNARSGRSVRCYVPSHSLLNYAHWRIVSPESSLARLKGCDGYIAQVWTGTSRTPNLYRGQLQERTFETAFLEYGAMQNLVRSTGRTVWYLNDPVEDNPDHDWGDYQRNWESTLVASLLQPRVSQYEVMPWPERIWTGTYPSATNRTVREAIPPSYALELQTVINALANMNQPDFEWDCGTARIGVMASDSLMFQRGEPFASDPHLSHFYGLALPLLKRGMPVEPVQLENCSIVGYLNQYDLLLMTYRGMKPLSAEVHSPIADWVRAGGTLVFWDDDGDPYHQVREWWNSEGRSFSTPRRHLFQLLGLDEQTKPGLYTVGQGKVLYRSEDPSALATRKDGDNVLVAAVKEVLAGTRVAWRETNYLLLRRGPYLVAAGLSESTEQPVKVLEGQFIDLFDAGLKLSTVVPLNPGTRHFLYDLSKTSGTRPTVIASACQALAKPAETNEFRCVLEGIANTPGSLLLRSPLKPATAELQGEPVPITYDAQAGLAWLTFKNQPRPRELVVRF